MQTNWLPLDTKFIGNVFDLWETNIQDSFVPEENVTVDEQFLTCVCGHYAI